MRHSSLVAVLALASAGVALPAVAQSSMAQDGEKHPIELGLDAGVSVNLSTPKTTDISIPVQLVRAGFFYNDRVSIEPQLRISSISGGGISLSTYTAALGVLWHLHEHPTGEGVYLRPFVGFTGVSGSGASETRTIGGGGVGIKVPIAHRLAARFEANYTHLFSSRSGNNALGVLAGLSFFTR
jgi:hypothetical protein